MLSRLRLPSVSRWLSLSLGLTRKLRLSVRGRESVEAAQEARGRKGGDVERRIEYTREQPLPDLLHKGLCGAHASLCVCECLRARVRIHSLTRETGNAREGDHEEAFMQD